MFLLMALAHTEASLTSGWPEFCEDNLKTIRQAQTAPPDLATALAQGSKTIASRRKAKVPQPPNPEPTLEANLSKVQAIMKELKEKKRQLELQIKQTKQKEGQLVLEPD